MPCGHLPPKAAKRPGGVSKYKGCARPARRTPIFASERSERRARSAPAAKIEVAELRALQTSRKGFVKAAQSAALLKEDAWHERSVAHPDFESGGAHHIGKRRRNLPRRGYGDAHGAGDGHDRGRCVRHPQRPVHLLYGRMRRAGNLGVQDFPAWHAPGQGGQGQSDQPAAGRGDPCAGGGDGRAAGGGAPGGGYGRVVCARRGVPHGRRLRRDVCRRMGGHGRGRRVRGTDAAGAAPAGTAGFRRHEQRAAGRRAVRADPAGVSCADRAGRGGGDDRQRHHASGAGT